MKVIISGYASRATFYARRELITALRKAGCKVYVVALDRVFEKELSEISDGFYGCSLSGCRFSPLDDYKYFCELYRIFREAEPDCIISYSIKPIVYGALASRKAGIKSFYAAVAGLGYPFGNADFKQRFTGLFASALYRFSLRYADKIFFQNKDDIELFRTRKIACGDNLCLIEGSGVDTEFFSEQPMPSGNIGFLMVARLLKDKGVFEFEKAASIVKKKYPDVSFKLLGPLGANPMAVSQAELDELIAAKNIEYLGETRDVRPYLRECSVMVLPSYYREGLPKAIIEAMSVGRPIITCNTPGCKETVIDGENGRLVPPKDPAALAETMISMIEQPELLRKMGKKSREIVLRRFDAELVNAEMKRLIEVK